MADLHEQQSRVTPYTISVDTPTTRSVLGEVIQAQLTYLDDCIQHWEAWLAEQEATMAYERAAMVQCEARRECLRAALREL